MDSFELRKHEKEVDDVRRQFVALQKQLLDLIAKHPSAVNYAKVYNQLCQSQHRPNPSYIHPAPHVPSLRPLTRDSRRPKGRAT